MINRPTFNEVFMEMAFVLARRSDDQSTKHGAILVNEFSIPIGFGYNGLPRKANPESFDLTRPSKYKYYQHAETNCLSNTTVDIRLYDATIYITGYPCIDCLQKCYQAGVNKFVMANRQCGMCDLSDDAYVKDLYLIKNEYRLDFTLMDVPVSWVNHLNDPGLDYTTI